MVLIISQGSSIESIRQRSSGLFSVLSMEKIPVKLCNQWDGSIDDLNKMNLSSPALIQVPREFVNLPEDLARYCGEHYHVLFTDDFWIDMHGKNRGAPALFAAIRRRFVDHRSKEIVINIRVPGENDWRIVRITQRQWEQFMRETIASKKTVEEAMQIKLTTGVTSSTSKGVAVAPLQPGTIIHGIGIYCGGPCKKIHPMDLPLSGNIRRITDEKGWVELTGTGFVCPECLASARRDQSRRNEANRQAKK